MRPESGVFPAKARKCLADAGAIAAVPLAEAAGRSAYLVGLHAAQALLFERETRVVKTHNGVHTEWQRLTRDDPRVETDLRGFLSRGSRLKVTADDGLDPLDSVTDEQASAAIAMAERLIALVEAKLSAPPA